MNSLFSFLVNEDNGLTTAGYVVSAIIIFLLIILASLLAGNKRKIGVKELTFSALALALAYVNSTFEMIKMPMGGAVTPFSMLFVTLIGYWYGPAVDLDGDGEASVNIAHELYGLNSDILPGKQKRTAARVLELQAPGIPNTISIDIPMQGVVKDPEDGSCHPSERMWATYSPQCVMNKDCNISFRNSESGSIANKIPLTKCMDFVKEAEMISLEPGYMHFTYKCVFYDFLTRSFVPGTVDAWLKRYTRADGSAL